MMKYFVDAAGKYIGGFSGEGALALVPNNSVEVPSAPVDARCIWDGAAWGDAPAKIKTISADDLAALLVAKNVVTSADVDGKMK